MTLRARRTTTSETTTPPIRLEISIVQKNLFRAMMLSSCFTTTTTTTPVGATRVVRLKRAAACFTFPMRTLSRRREVNVTPRAENDDSPKVHVPCGAFGGTSSPERKAADVMHQLLTYTATWVVIGQLESINCRLDVQTPDGLSTEVNLDGQGEAKRVNNQHEFLLKFLEENPIGRQNPDEWLAKLMKEDLEFSEQNHDGQTRLREHGF